MRKYVSNPLAKTNKKDKSKSKVLTRYDLSRMKWQLSKSPNSTSKIIFENLGLGHVSKSTCFRVLRIMAKHVILDIRPPLKQLLKNSCLEWAGNYMKIDFKHVLFADKMRATLDGPDEWSKVRVPERLRHQQGGGGIVIWAGVVDSELVWIFEFLKV